MYGCLGCVAGPHSASPRLNVGHDYKREESASAAGNQFVLHDSALFEIVKCIRPSLFEAELMMQ